MDIDTLIALAERHARDSGNESADIAATDARELHNKGMDNYARDRALASLQYSVGIFNEDYKLAIA